MTAPEVITVEQSFNAALNAMTVDKVREWCDTRHALGRSHLDWEHTPGMCCVRVQSRLDAIAELRALLPPALAVGEAECLTASTEDP